MQGSQGLHVSHLLLTGAANVGATALVALWHKTSLNCFERLVKKKTGSDRQDDRKWRPVALRGVAYVRGCVSAVSSDNDRARRRPCDDLAVYGLHRRRSDYG